jgi:hypothetical protein
MTARTAAALAALASLLTASPAFAQSTSSMQTTSTVPQTPPNAGAAEAQPQTVTGPGGSTTLPANGSQPQPTVYPNQGNNDVSAPPAGPQKNLGKRYNQTVHYVTGDYMVPVIVHNAATPGVTGTDYRSTDGTAVFEVPLGQYDIYVGGETRRSVYDSPGGLVRTIGGGTAAVLPFSASDYDYDERAGLKLDGPRVYVAFSYLTHGTTYAEPQLHGIGYGIEKLADTNQTFSLYGNAFYYPNVGGNYTLPGSGGSGFSDLSYHIVRYRVGVAILPYKSPVFIEAGFLGDYAKARTDAPGAYSHYGPFAGLGIRF